jgi:hypothetical protein
LFSFAKKDNQIWRRNFFNEINGGKEYAYFLWRLDLLNSFKYPTSVLQVLSLLSTSEY